MLPATLVSSIRSQKTRAHLDQLKTKKKSSISSSRNKEKHGMMSDNEVTNKYATSKNNAKLKFNVAKCNQCRQLGKSKNQQIIAPIFPLPNNNCHCKYPSERLPTNSIRDGLTILPGTLIYCRDIYFICNVRDTPQNAVEWTCPNLNPIIPLDINKSKGKGKSKNAPAIIGNPGIIGGIIGGTGGIIINTRSKAK